MATSQPKSPKGQMAKLLGEEELETEKPSLWLEIRIPTNAELDKTNLKSVYRWIYNEARGEEDVFELAVIGMESSEGRGLRTRYFMKAPDHSRKRDLWNRLETTNLNVCEVEEPPDFSTYEQYVDFEMDDDFALPLIPQEKMERGSIPRIPKQFASAVKDGGALRMAVKRDDNARNHIQSFINREEGKSGDPFSVIVGLFDNLTAGRTTDGVPKTHRGKPRREEETRYSRLAKSRKDAMHFHCKFRAYGNETQVRRISNSFSFGSVNDIVESGGGKPGAVKQEAKEEIRQHLKSGFGQVGSAREQLKRGTDPIETLLEMEEEIQESLDEPKYFRTERGREELASTLTTVSEAIDEASERVSDVPESLSDASEDVSDALEKLRGYHESRLVPSRPSGAGGRLLKATLFLPFVLPILLVWMGLWNPFFLLESHSLMGLALSLWPVLLPLAITVGSWLWLFGRKGKPIILTLEELSAIGSLPPRPEVLPVEFETPAISSSGEGEPEEDNEKTEDGGE